MHITESNNKSNGIISISCWNFRCNISKINNLFNIDTIKVLSLQIFTPTNSSRDLTALDSQTLSSAVFPDQMKNLM